MKKIRQRAAFCTLFILIFLGALLVLLNRYRKHSDEWFETPYNRHIYSSENVLLSGTILDRNGLMLSHVEDGKRLYSTDEAIRKATLHVVGDRYGKIGTSALATMRDLLVAYKTLRGVASVSEQGNTVHLTVDAVVNAAALKALGDRTGTVCVYNYETGEILALVSTPTYDPDNIPENLETDDRYSGVYLNRFLQTTATPGSVLKPVILQAALETLTASDMDASLSGSIEDFTYNCTGTARFADGTVRCPKAHGKQTLSQTLANSCNCAYAALSVKMGADTVSEYLQNAGLTASYTVGNTRSARGTFEITGIADYRLGYAGVGLYHDQVNPCSLLVYYGAIAGGGTAAVPTTLGYVTDDKGKEIYRPETVRTGRLLKASSAEYLRKALMDDVVLTYGASRFPCTIGAKSGTVETSEGRSNSWFAGFTADEDKPYAFVVYLEHAGSGSRAAGDVAAAVLRAILDR